MKRFCSVVLMLTVLSLTAMPSVAQQRGRGGPMGFIAGCCFGVRAAVDYNDGKEIHFREWGRIIPFVGIVFAIWDGVDGYSGKTRADFANEYGATFY